ncbi:MAG: rRNA maturation RNase YbeY [Proteobacteria bacterium]|nr:rRNA maturation RNase YbeY [Pseudomonadota bacterium]
MLTAMPVDVQIASVVADLPALSRIKTWGDAVLRHPVVKLDPAHTTLCVRLVDQEESQALNTRYRNVDKPTNVLSFTADVSLPDERILGDVVICTQVVGREAVEQNKSSDDHYAHMVVHGTLHLLGYDHQRDEDAAHMEQLEIDILSDLGVLNPYQT